MAETYEQKRDRYIRQRVGDGLDGEAWGRILGMTEAQYRAGAQALQQSKSKFLSDSIRGMSSIESAERSGVTAADLTTYRDLQDNMVKLDQTASQKDEIALQEARKAAQAAAGGFTPNSPEFRVAYLQSLATSLGTGDNNPALYGTMKQAMSELGYDASNIDSWSSMLSLQFANPADVDRLRRIQTAYAEQAHFNQNTHDMLQTLNGMMHDAPDASEGDEAAKAWFQRHAREWQQLQNLNRQVKPVLEQAVSTGGGFLNARVAGYQDPALVENVEDMHALQEALLANPPGTMKAKPTSTTTPEDDEERRMMALFIDNKNTRRLADEYGLGIGHVVKIDDPNKLADFQARFPEGTYIPNVGIYVPGVDDQKALDLAHHDMTRADPRGNVLERPFVRKPEEQPTYADIYLPAELKPAKVVKQVGFNVETNTAYYEMNDGSLYASSPSGTLKVDAVAPGTLPMNAQVSEITDPKMKSDLAKAEADIRSFVEANPQVLHSHVEIQPHLYNDEDRIRFLNPQTNRSELAPPGARKLVVGGGGPRQTIRGLAQDIDARMSQNRGADYANQADEVPVEERRKHGMEDLAETLVPKTQVPDGRERPPLPPQDLPPLPEVPVVPLTPDGAATPLPETPDNRMFQENAPVVPSPAAKAGGDAAQAAARSALLQQYAQQGRRAVSPPPVAPVVVPPVPEQATPVGGFEQPSGGSEVPFEGGRMGMPPKRPNPPAAPPKAKVQEAGGSEQEEPPKPEGTTGARSNILKKYKPPAYASVAGGRNPNATQDGMASAPTPSQVLRGA